jgi:ATP-dependent helicase/nuclease subunit A
MTVSEIIYTSEQKKAMELRDKNLLISAAAGAGKTSVMVERITRMAVDRVNPIGLDRMLVVTFTNAAAAEMKERIRKSLYSELKKSPGDSNIRKQIMMLNQANISTVHSFCSEVIRSNYHLLDVDPAFSVSDEMDSSLLLNQAIEEILNVKYEENAPGFSNMVNTFGRGRDDSNLMEMLSSLYRFLRSMPEYLNWMDEKTEMFKINTSDFSDTQWGQVLIKYARLGLTGLISEMKAASELNVRIGGPIEYEQTALLDIEALSEVLKVLQKSGWDECREVLSRELFGKLASAPKGTPDYLKDLFKSSRDRVKKEYKKISAFFSGDSITIMNNHKEMAPMFMCLNEAIHGIDERYRVLKNKRGILDYNDLEHYALECLKGDAGEMYRRKFIEVFIDEYQDSNPIQEMIIKYVSGRDRSENNVFMVGDLKQSIYRFRHAEPRQFKDKYDKYSKESDAPEVSIELSDNYRSREQIIAFNNLIFDRIMTEDSAGLDYRRNARLVKGAQYPENDGCDYSVDIRIACIDDKMLYDASYNRENKEAAVAGREILRLINSGFLITDKARKTQRPVEFRDITILMRSVKNRADRFVAQLAAMGIPARSGGSSDFFGAYENIVMTDFLKILDNPRQDISLLAVLRSTMFGFSDRELAAIRADSNADCFFDCLKGYSGKRTLEEKVEKFIESYESYRNLSPSLAVDKLLWMIMNETGFYNSPGHVISIESAQANLRRLFELAGSYEKTSVMGVAGFIRHMENLKESGQEVAVPAAGGNLNEVNVMSIHKSKGLEFPVVILSGTGIGFNRTDKQEALLWDRELGFGPDFINYEQGYKIRTAAKKSLQVRGEDEDTREELRILYVALTRAREKLILTGSIKNPETESRRWILTGTTENGIINPGKVLGAGSHLEWIMACISEHTSGRCIIEEANVPSSSVLHQNDAELTIEYIYPEEIVEILGTDSQEISIQNHECYLSYDEIRERFNWHYQFEGEKGIHRKISVTELKKARETEDGSKSIFGYQMNKKPSFLENASGPNAAERGTLLHNVLAAIDFKRADDSEHIADLLKKAAAPAESIKGFTGLIKGFLESPLGLRAMAASNVISEKAFLYPIQATRVYPEKEGVIDPGHTIMLQGIIDCMFFEDGNIIMIDYKSDNVEPGNEEAHAKRYSLQLELYSEAAEGLTGLGVSERYIHFLKTGVSVRL